MTPAKDDAPKNVELQYTCAENHLEEHSHHQVASVVDKEKTVQSHQNQISSHQPLSIKPASTPNKTNRKYEQQWLRNYQLLIDFKEKNGHCRVKYTAPVLGNWVQVQRTNYQKGIISEERKQKLNKIGFLWHLTTLSWNGSYALLVEFRKKTGHCRVHNCYDKGLSNWVKHQRKTYHKGGLSKDRVKKLDDIDFEWKLQKLSWHDKYLLLAEFIKKHGHCQVKRKTCLGAWVMNQRSFYKKGRLSDDRVKELDEIGFEWRPSATNKKYPNDDRQQQDDNHRPQEKQQQTATAMTVTSPPTTSPIPEVVTSQPFIEMDNGNVGSNICEEYKKTVTYSCGDSENWV